MTLFLVHRCWRQLTCLLTVLLFFSVCLAPRFCSAAQKQELLIGIEPEHNIFDQVRKYRAMSRYLSDHLGIEVKLTIMSRYGEVVKRFRSMHLDGAILSPFTTELAIRELGLTPVAVLEREDGSVVSKGLVFVRQDSELKNVNDMRGKSVVFVDPATTEGYVFARAFFRKNGVDDMNSFFDRHYFSGSHTSAVYAVLDGRAEIGAAKDTVYNQLVKKDPSMGNELRIIAESPPVPEVTLCMKSDLEPMLMEKLRISLFKMDQTVEGHRVLRTLEANRFTPSGPGDFSVVSELFEEAGLIN